MATFPDPWRGLRTPGPTLGPRVIQTGTPEPAAIPGGGMTLDALLARQKALSVQGGPQMGEMISPMQGISYALQEGLHGFQQGMADRHASEASQALGGALSQIDPETGDLPAAARAIVGQLAPEDLLKITQAMVESRRAARELEQKHTWDVQGREDTQQAAADLAAQAQGATSSENRLSREATATQGGLNRTAEQTRLDDQQQAAEDLAVANAGRAKTTAEDTSAREVAAAGSKITAETGARMKAAEALGLKPGTPEWQTYVATGGSPAHVDTPQEKLDKEVEARKAEALKLGMKEGTPEFENYTLTGQIGRRPTMTPTELNLIAEADDKANALSGQVTELTDLITPDETGQSVNDRAYSGAGAGTAQFGARNDPTGLLFDKKRGEATTRLENTISAEAIAGMKALFGTNPTEGERAALLDLQGSKDKSPTERRQIIERTIKVAKIRLQQAKLRAEQLRQGTFAAEQGGPSGSGDQELDDLLKKY